MIGREGLMIRAREKSNTGKHEHSVGVEWCDNIKADRVYMGWVAWGAG
jgi:hypothetical protein